MSRLLSPRKKISIKHNETVCDAIEHSALGGFFRRSAGVKKKIIQLGKRDQRLIRLRACTIFRATLDEAARGD